MNALTFVVRIIMKTAVNVLKHSGTVVIIRERYRYSVRPWAMRLTRANTCSFKCHLKYRNWLVDYKDQPRIYRRSILRG